MSPVPLCPQVALVYPNNDPAAFMTAFYGCLLAEVVPVPIEVPLTRKVSRHDTELNAAKFRMTSLSLDGDILRVSSDSEGCFICQNYTIKVKKMPHIELQ